jgi:hypothetical protein
MHIKQRVISTDKESNKRHKNKAPSIAKEAGYNLH